jgi:two-component system, NtrC family, nitrogen regulation sensor histidine kinase NtrY
MKNRLKKNLLVFPAVFFLLFAFFLERGGNEKNYEKNLVAEFQKELIKKETELELSLAEILEISLKPDFSDLYLNELAPFNQSVEKKGLGFLVYKNRKLIYWSDRAVAFWEYLPVASDPTDPLLIFPNGYYLRRTVIKDSITIVGLVLIKYNYSHENQYLANSFFKDFSLPDQFILNKTDSLNRFTIHNKAGKKIFTLVPQEKIVNKTRKVYASAIFYIIGLAFFLLFFRRLIHDMPCGKTLKLFASAILLLIIFLIHLFFRIPGFFDQIDFFSPAHFAYNSILPSLGDFFLFTFLLFYFIINLYWDLRLGRLKLKPHFPGLLLVILMYILLALCFGGFVSLINSLIYNSSFSFALNQINEITVPTVLGIASLMMLLFGLILLSLRLADEALKLISAGKVLWVLLLTPFFSALLYLIFTKKLLFPAGLLFLAVNITSLLYASRKTRKYEMSYLVVFISVITLFSLYIIYSTTDKKEREVQKLFAVTLVEEHDPAAEVFLVEIQQQINSDHNIRKYLVPPFSNLDQYFESTYFSGYFRQYDLQITICTEKDTLTIQPQNNKSHCYEFFDAMINDQGTSRLPGTDFYYIQKMDGRISYLGRLHYLLSHGSAEVSVFIDLKSKIQSEGIGFPELLIDKSIRKPSGYKRFDYAKYFGGELVDKHGNFPYNNYIYSYDFEDSEFTYTKWDGYEHLIHRTSENNYVIVSRSLYGFLDYLISFPYLFVFYFLSSLLVLLFIVPSRKKRPILFDLKFRIQAAIISIVFISLLLVAIGTIFYNIKESNTRLQTDLDQKMNSISVELDLRLGNEKVLSPNMSDWLLPELVKLSNIFQTDINIYSGGGDLIVSSRPEIFNRGLVSRKISTQAYYELFENFQTNYFQPEEIGELSYLSAYEPIINNTGDYLGFINLPYFTHQGKYSLEISTFIVAFINLYVLLFLASIVIAVFIANQITLPLVTIRENLRKIELGKRNEPINYIRQDEIGKLVKEYNKKVDELAVSADLLARSERESAWREMAKQIAHEIKNPLTPMKLNIQHLQRFKGEGREYQEYVNRISQTLINQIDTLSDIATEFSNFAQIPTAMKQVFNLSSQIKKVIELYEIHDRIHISFLTGECGEIKVYADREQLSRALINLIKNGIQAIPEEREGYIRIVLERKNSIVVISVADNGTGIPPELQEKMFSPNFTTKSSGMGLGLAIVKNIAENFNGRVWYETNMRDGTIFYLEIPVYEHSSDGTVYE